MVDLQEEKLIELFHDGSCADAWKFFGVHKVRDGFRFTVYAPHARRVSVVGTFTGWQQRPLRMVRTEYAGVWSAVSHKAIEGDCYKYQIEDSRGRIIWKADPYAFAAEYLPQHASRIFDIAALRWHDEDWLKGRTKNFTRPMNIYEVFAGGWKKEGEGCSYRFLQNTLIPYCKEMGFTHVEFMPLTEYPCADSWGYQAGSYYAVTSRYGSPREFAELVEALHENGIGVIFDLVPVHFARDAWGLAKFDGEPLYEYSRSYDAESPWGTLNFNLWKGEVRSFLISACSFWCEIYHVDGLRLDAVSNMIWWGGERSRGTNEGALNFIRRLNYSMHTRHPEVMMIAEDSTDYPHVTYPVEEGGLGFDYKWDLGWMNDTLSYYSTDPLYRGWDHGKITFSMAYYNSENFLMPLSHDENVHGKKTIIDRMWGDYDTKFAEARSLYAYMFAHPGKKLNFMGNELAMFREFDEKRELDWLLLEYSAHNGFHRYFQKLCQLYSAHPALYEHDYDGRGFAWLDAENAKESILIFARSGTGETIVCILNMTPQGYENRKIRVAHGGAWDVLLNSEDMTDSRNMTAEECDGNWYVTMDLAPFAAVWLIGA